MGAIIGEGFGIFLVIVSVVAGVVTSVRQLRKRDGRP